MEEKAIDCSFIFLHQPTPTFLGSSLPLWLAELLPPQSLAHLQGCETATKKKHKKKPEEDCDQKGNASKRILELCGHVLCHASAVKQCLFLNIHQKRAWGGM